MNAWKCYNCDVLHGIAGGRDFVSEKPVCPFCGADGETDRGRHCVVARVILHFDPPTEVYGKGHNYLACDPQAKILGNKNGYRATGDHRIVTCEACKTTKVYRQAVEGGADLSGRVRTVAVNQPPDDVPEATEPASKPKK